MYFTVVFEIDALDLLVLVEVCDEGEEEDGNEERTADQDPQQLQHHHHNYCL